jgi:hypothetical protein
MKKSLVEEIQRQKELMSLSEQTSIGQSIGQEIVQALKNSVGKSVLDLAFGDQEDYLGSDDEMEISKDVTPLTKTTTDDEFYKAILKGVGAPITDENMKFMYAWRQAEGGKAKNNPFNTTQPKTNSTFYNCLKKGISGCQSGVRNYMSSRDGIDATIRTLQNGRYRNILDALKKGTSAEQTAMALKASPWGTGQLALKVVQGYNSGSSPKPPQIA